MREIKTNLVQLLIVNGDSKMIRKLEIEAENNYVFVMDNGKEIVRRKDESLGNYVDRYSIGLMKNFSRKKYEKLKTLCNEYNICGDSKIVEESFIIAEETEKKNGIIVAIENMIGNLFRNSKKKFV
ncbi:MAG: hypothetical protein ACRDDY_10260 [Clostridium sp.]|uniref:hypothetical protein n=1 Tax=Clostridium sp. TaxID=1506 RepID=UPI003EE6C81D